MLTVRHAAPKGPPDEMWRPHAEKLQARVSQLERQLMAREDVPVPQWPSKRSITVILTVHNRKEMAWQAYQSILDAGFTNGQILILESGSVHMGGIARTVVCNPLWDNNRCWLHAVESCDSSHVIFLHDDDLMGRGLAEKLQGRDDWEVAYWDAIQFGGADGPISYFHCKEGVYSGALVQDLSKRIGLTISTIQGCFPKWLAQAAFARWASEFSSPDFLIRSGMAVGNDLLLWWMAGESEKVWVIRQPYSMCRNHPESTTVAGLGGKIESIYAAVRNRVGMGSPKIIQILGHMPKTYPSAPFLSNLEANKPTLPTVFVSRKPMKLPGWIKNVVADDLDGSAVPPIYQAIPRYQYAIYGFVNACRIACDSGADFMCYIEEDCRVASKWDLALRDETIGSAREVWTAGTPCVWNTFSGFRRDWVAAANRYSVEYEKVTGFVPAMEGINNEYGIGPCVFTNGAFSFYSRRAMEEVFVEKMRTHGLAYFKGAPPYDATFGSFSTQAFDLNAFKVIRWLPSLYSGCGDHWYGLHERLSMLASGRVVACHQVK